jgi:hypothetical protein
VDSASSNMPPINRRVIVCGMSTGQSSTNDKSERISTLGLKREDSMVVEGVVDRFAGSVDRCNGRCVMNTEKTLMLHGEDGARSESSSKE